MSKQDKEPDLSIESSNSLSIEKSERGSRRGGKSLKRKSPPPLLPSAPLPQVQAGERSQKLLPIYIHSLFRAGSTYLFHVFRRSKAGYWCYQEPLHEVAFAAKNNLGDLLNFCGDYIQHLRHPKMEDSYFRELHDVANQCLERLNSNAIYDSYFAPQGVDIGIDYLRALIEAARGRPVIQECRTSSRIGAIKSSLGGFHIYLWRNPWDQWWSYKVTDYFDATNQLFINVPMHPEVIARLRREIGFTGHEDSDLLSRIAWFREQQLPPDQSYLIFYVLWCLGLQEGMLNADMLLNIDHLNDSLEYRQQVLDHLSGNSITDLDFSDCSIPQAFYSDTDQTFFSRIEDKAHGLFLLSGMSQTDINQLLAIRHEYEPQIWQSPISKIDPSGLLRDAERARALVVKAEGHEVELRIKYRDEISRQEQRVVVAEARAQEQEQRAITAEARAQEQERRALAAENRAQEQERRALAAESRAEEQERRALAAENRAQEQERRAVAAENHAEEQEWLVQADETRIEQQQKRIEEQQKRIDELGGNSHHWWLQATAAEAREKALRQSLSWKITAPLRLGLDAVYVLMGRKKPPFLPRTAVGKPALVAGVHRSLRPFPRLYAYVTQKVDRIVQTPSQYLVVTGIGADNAFNLSRFTPSAQRIYAELKAAIEKNRDAR